jgi:hypothetical protein
VNATSGRFVRSILASVLAPVFAVGALCIPRAANADAPPKAENYVPDTYVDVHAPTPMIALKAGGAAFGSYPPHDVDTHFGGALGLSLGVIPEKLDVDLTAQFVSSESGSLLPISLLMKRPFYISRVVRPYVGAGLRIEVPITSSDETHLGIATSYGSYFWFKPNLGLFAEVNANVMFAHRGTPEAGMTTGLAVGF